MPDFDSIPLDDPEPNHDDGTVNRPAEGARKATASELGDDWTGSDEGGDFLGLEADLGSGAPAADSTADLYGDNVSSPLELADSSGGLHVPDPEPQPLSPSYASEGEYSDESFSEGGYQQDPNAFAPDDYEYDSESGEGDDSIEGFDEDISSEFRSSGSRSGVLITIGLALGMGATAVVAMDYFGLAAEEELPPAVATSAAPGPVDREVASSVVVTTPAVNDSTSLSEITPSAPTWSAEALEAPAFESGQDPLISTLLGEEGSSELAQVEPAQGATTPEVSKADPKVVLAPTTTTVGEMAWEGVEGTSSPVGTIAGWFAPDGAQPMRDAMGGAQVAMMGDTVDDGGEVPATAQRGASTVTLTEEPAGPDAPENAGLAGLVGEVGTPANVMRGGVAEFDDMKIAPVLPITRAADDLAKMDVVWRGEEVPFDMIASAARIWTPQVGPVRVTTKRGEVFEGRLTAVGKRRVWLGNDSGEMALDGDTVSVIEHVTRTPDTTSDSEVAAATGRRVKVTAPGGTFEGTVLSVTGSQVTVVTDGGGRITLDDPALEPVRQGINVKVKAN